LNNNYTFIFYECAKKYIQTVPEKDKRLISEKISICLGDFLKTPTKQCNKKLIKGSKKCTYRLHVGKKHTIFYRIDDDLKNVYIIDIMGINQAHSKYGIV